MHLAVGRSRSVSSGVSAGRMLRRAAGEALRLRAFFVLSTTAPTACAAQTGVR